MMLSKHIINYGIKWRKELLELLMATKMKKPLNNNNNEYVDPNLIKIRSCLKCGKGFKSTSNTNRRCMSCKQLPEFKNDSEKNKPIGVERCSF